jgi:hypothetical protein
VAARIADVLGRVEALPRASTGALLVGDRAHPHGLIVIERDRVCWIGATGMGRRLRDILRSHSSIPLREGEIEALYARCRATDTPLGEALVMEGYVAPEQMRAAMKQHTAESLLALDAAHGSTAGWPLTWIGRGDRGYNPRFTFTATEILAAVGANLVDPTLVELAEDELASAAKSGCAALALTSADDGTPQVIGESASADLLVSESLELAEWANDALGASEGFSPLAAHACARQATTGGTAAWRYEGCFFAAVCPSTESLVRLVACVDNQGLPMVVSTTSAVSRRIRERGSVRQSERS